MLLPGQKPVVVPGVELVHGDMEAWQAPYLRRTAVGGLQAGRRPVREQDPVAEPPVNAGIRLPVRAVGSGHQPARVGRDGSQAFLIRSRGRARPVVVLDGGARRQFQPRQLRVLIVEEPVAPDAVGQPHRGDDDRVGRGAPREGREDARRGAEDFGGAEGIRHLRLRDADDARLAAEALVFDPVVAAVLRVLNVVGDVHVAAQRVGDFDHPAVHNGCPVGRPVVVILEGEQVAVAVAHPLDAAPDDAVDRAVRHLQVAGRPEQPLARVAVRGYVVLNRLVGDEGDARPVLGGEDAPAGVGPHV